MRTPTLLIRYRRCLCLGLLCLASCTSLYAQSALGGDWEGLSTQDNGNRFSLSLHLEQTGRSLSGSMEELSVNDPNQYVLMRVSGNVQGDSIQLFDLAVISESSPKNIRWCKKIRWGSVSRSSEGTRLEGSWKNDSNFVFKKTRLRLNFDNPCLPGGFVLYRKNSGDIITELPKPGSLLLPPQKPASPEEIMLTQAAARKDVVKQLIEVFSDSLLLQFYDNGEIDGDTITVIYNGQVLLAHRGLTARPLEITIPVARGSENKLQMFADNVGSIPPNTALLIFYDGRKKHVVYLDADGGKNAVVRIGRQR